MSWFKNLMMMPTNIAKIADGVGALAKCVKSQDGFAGGKNYSLATLSNSWTLHNEKPAKAPVVCTPRVKQVAPEEVPDANRVPIDLESLLSKHQSGNLLPPRRDIYNEKDLCGAPASKKAKKAGTKKVSPKKK